MKIFSGVKTPDFPTPPRIFSQGGSSSGGSSPTSRRSSFALGFSSPRLLSGSNSPITSPTLPQENSTLENLSPELVPIVTLLSAHTHRRYYEGIFLMLQDLKNDGSPGPRKWQEVYGMLVGTQLALWDANELASYNLNDSRPKLKQVASKPRYVNFSDAAVRLLDGSDAVVTENNEKLQNTLVVSTTLKNRYFLQYSDKVAFDHWNAAIQLSLFECTSLQEAYTGAFLSSRGAQLGDIKTLLADSKFDYEDWVSVRFGTGMPWKRCYAVIYQPQSRKKNSRGHISFYENDKKTKKDKAIATIVTSTRLYAVYPSSPLLIDTSTIIKLEGAISFEKKDIPQDTNVFIMPEMHQAVPGYDTIIRFLVPAMNAFKLYGRPQKLIADKDDFRSLLFGLPTLPHVHYLKVEELLPLASSGSASSWTSHDWISNIKEILQNKMSSGYTGCGSSSGMMGAISSPVLSSASFNESSLSLLSKVKSEKVEKNKATYSSDSRLCLSKSRSDDALSNRDLTRTMSATADNGLHLQETKKSETESTTTTSVYSEQGGHSSKSPGRPFGKTRDKYSTGIHEPDSSPLKQESSKTSNNLNPTRNPTTQSSSELDNIYHKYSLSPFGKANEADASPQIGEHLFDNPYKRHSNGDKINVPKVRQAAASTINEESESLVELTTEIDSISEEQDALKEFNDLAKRINELDIGTALESDRTVPQDKASPWDIDRPIVEATHGEANVFDPDFMEQAQMLETDSRHTGSESISDVSSEDAQIWQDSREGANESILHSDLSQVAQTKANRYNGIPNQGRRPPPRSMGQVANLNQFSVKPAPLSDTPYGHSPQAPGIYPQQGNMPPAQPVMKPGGLPPHNFPRFAPHQQNPYNPHPPRPYAPGLPQQQFAKNGTSYPRYYNAPPFQQRIPPGGMVPTQRMYQQAGRAGSYLPPAQPMAKPRSPASNGFSNFMPTTTVNPYAQ